LSPPSAAFGVTVSDVDRSADFYVRVLDFRRDVEIEVAGEPFERLSGIFGVRTRTARVRLGEECLDLTEYVAPRGRPAPADSRSNDRWFQHVAIVVADMDRAY
jgi:catechol 2,3-dioxygenase-like lactoylglutathione lyase family enzyme